jgi:hypothetical protein
MMSIQSVPSRELRGFAAMAKRNPELHRFVSSIGGQMSVAGGNAHTLNSTRGAIASGIRYAVQDEDDLMEARLRYRMKLEVAKRHRPVQFMMHQLHLAQLAQREIIAKKAGAKKAAPKTSANKSANKTALPASKGAGTPKKTGKKK